MNQHQEIVGCLPLSPRASTMMLDLHSDALHYVIDERQLVEARRSSWALTSRLNRMKKRHPPPSCKSSPAEPHREKRSRSSKKTVEQKKAQNPNRLSRWESSISTPKGKREWSSPNASTTGKRCSGRPILPRRQKSIENSSMDEESASSTHVTKSNDSAETLRSCRRSFHPEARFGASSTRSFSSAARVI
jgi:hypothetical protein